jgi:hypothetical protein
LVECLLACYEWSIACLVAWLAAWLIAWLLGWLLGRLLGCLVGSSVSDAECQAELGAALPGWACHVGSNGCQWTALGWYLALCDTLGACLVVGPAGCAACLVAWLVGCLNIDQPCKI